MKLKEIISKKIIGTGNWVKSSLLDQYNNGLYWTTIEEFLNDKDVIISEKTMIEVYLKELKKIKLDLDNDAELVKFVNRFIDKYVVYLSCEEISASYSYSDEL